MKAREIVHCRGHPNISALHPTTFEITRDMELTPAGDCVIGVGANKGPLDLSTGFRSLLAREGSTIVTRLCCDDLCVEVHAEGSPGLALDHPHDLVWRRSNFTCGRTIGIRTDYTAATLPRELIERLAAGEEMIVELFVECPDDLEQHRISPDIENEFNKCDPINQATL
ncbi:MAG: DUF371 domain-containing protein [Methanoregulaceae archaeon]|nr:DUF371 domain-containing protein [Methanoregulaceae archaeon]